MRKELTESMAALEAVEAAVEHARPNSKAVNRNDTLALDCYCSIGLTTSVLAASYPEASVVGVDCDRRLTGRTHFAHPGRHSIVTADLLRFDSGFDALAAGRSLVIITAVHACGLLAFKP